MVRLGHVFLATLAEKLQLDSPQVPSVAPNIDSLSSRALPPNLESLARMWRDAQSLGAGSLHQEAQAHNLRLEAGADALVSDFLRGVPSIGLPIRPNSETVPPGASARVSIRLNALTTTKVTEARRLQKLIFTGAIHDAIARVAARYPQHPLAKSYAAFFPVDLRQAIVSTGAATEDQLMFGLYFSGLPICIDGLVPGESDRGKAKSFIEIAREMTAVYNRDLTAFWTSPDGHEISLMELAEPYLQRTTLLFNTPPPKGFPPTQTPELSGLGKVESYLQREYQSTLDPLAPKIEVSDMWIGTEKLDRCVQLHVWSWRDELRLGASLNQSFYEKSSVAVFLNQVVEELTQGLGITVDDDPLVERKNGVNYVRSLITD